MSVVHIRQAVAAADRPAAAADEDDDGDIDVDADGAVVVRGPAYTRANIIPTLEELLTPHEPPGLRPNETHRGWRSVDEVRSPPACLQSSLVVCILLFNAAPVLF